MMPHNSVVGWKDEMTQPKVGESKRSIEGAVRTMLMERFTVCVCAWNLYLVVTSELEKWLTNEFEGIWVNYSDDPSDGCMPQFILLFTLKGIHFFLPQLFSCIYRNIVFTCVARSLQTADNFINNYIYGHTGIVRLVTFWPRHLCLTHTHTNTHNYHANAVLCFVLMIRVRIMAKIFLSEFPTQIVFLLYVLIYYIVLGSCSVETTNHTLWLFMKPLTGTEWWLCQDTSTQCAFLYSAESLCSGVFVEAWPCKVAAHASCF